MVLLGLPSLIAHITCICCIIEGREKHGEKYILIVDKYHNISRTFASYQHFFHYNFMYGLWTLRGKQHLKARTS